MMRSWTSRIAQGGRTGDISVISNHCVHITRNWSRKDIPKFRAGSPVITLINCCLIKDGRFNIARALVGSEGTLVTILEAKCV